ncbi:MAG: hypothetical protein N4A74_22945 [Carboxylicivirga sp.]|jgi:hypothetical protein|nr:hypothetical protein [Carboxylicivirga sp.]
MKLIKIYSFTILLITSLVACNTTTFETQKTVNGWNILSDNINDANSLISKASHYKVNHLQISHEIVHDLKQVRNNDRQNLVNELTTKAHNNGVDDVFVWDHALYKLDYYPEKFIRQEDGKIDLDNKEFWEWFKDDYRNMLDLVPDIDGIVLTFIETGARIEDQYSEKYKTIEEKLALLVDAVADVVINERNKDLIIRTFFYSYEELDNVTKCLDLIQHKEVALMCKETPHDFFVTHPVSTWIKDLDRPVLIEFDCAHEFSGQGIVASAFPGVHMERWKTYAQMDNVIGFCIRTSRYGNTLILDTPTEVNLFALHQLLKTPELTETEVLTQFISEKYGERCVSTLLPVFESADDITLASFYTLGLNTTHHSRMNLHYRSIYTRHVSGRWLENKTINVGHGVDKQFHYWKDIVNHLAPAEYKKASKANNLEIKEVLDNGWLQAEELMNETYLSDIIAEKDFAVAEAQKALELIKKAKALIADEEAYNKLYNTFYRTQLSAKLYRAAAKMYYGKRIALRGESFITSNLKKALKEGYNEYEKVFNLFENYNIECPVGQLNWKKSAKAAAVYTKGIKEIIN